ncbi:hypothetical protein HHK36_014329 [Tetracentron sinense]|uniref:Uncharacterized protein n=1 Tax=Tetracentron sinense TaxID=13715 RepID=A0A835DFA9_TETSI|nr:hypothetical protein HHK36_014329 [Tetracentron sinense]
MDDFRSKSYGDGRMQMESYYGGRPHSSGPHDFRCYSASYASSAQQSQMAKEVKFKKGKNTGGDGSSSKSWSFNDPEWQRKKRVATYKSYAVEGKMKGSFRKSFRGSFPCGFRFLDIGWQLLWILSSVIPAIAERL